MGIYVRAAGKVGRAIGTKAGGYVGSHIGKKLGSEKMGRQVGQKIGGYAGSRIAKKAAVATPVLGSLKRGGRIKKTGLYRLHKGEYVLTKRKARKMKKY